MTAAWPALGFGHESLHELWLGRIGGSAGRPYLNSSVHMRAYGNVAQLPGKYVRAKHDLTQPEPERRFLARTFSRSDRGV
jgi:hypothetical protein